ncbi:MAG: hypothetical protein EXQ96_10150 [Alphaproteobacteria bacterium]|nr:hypothetical protein [Alphaproteobacteria bacterium]
MVLRAVAALAAPAGAADAAYGEYLAAECSTCHLRSGDFKGIPSIVGLPEADFIAALRAYRDRSRENVVMQTIAKSLSDADMAALAAYYHRLGTKR